MRGCRLSATTYDVRIYQTEVYRGQRKVTHYVRWKVADTRHRKGHATAALADSFRSELVTATRRGEAFDIASGLPLSLLRTEYSMSWYAFACAYADLKWPRVAATTRRTHAEALTALTVAMLTDRRNRPDAKLIRTALCRWAFNTTRREDPSCPADIRDALRWVDRHCRPVGDLVNSPAVLRAVLDSLTVRLDGKPAASSVVNRRRKIFNAALEYAVETKLLEANPIPALKWSAPRTVHEVDKRSVANPVQARTLLNAVRDIAPQLEAFFGCLYFAALRPEEAAALSKDSLALPEEGWGELNLERARPYAGREWTDSGEDRDTRQLKQRERGEVRSVPCPPELTALLHRHLATFGTTGDGRLFVGERNRDALPKLTVVRTWQRARAAVFTPEVLNTPLVKRPYDLRHAAVSTWLNGGVPATTVAAWAGHSVEILLKIYAKCLDGQDAAVRRRVEGALGWSAR
jgi:hypothetical protein